MYILSNVFFLVSARKELLQKAFEHILFQITPFKIGLEIKKML
jgi:hypothetical protein